MRIGVFGGTFDPIHMGHLIVAEDARAALELDKVLFIPGRTALVQVVQADYGGASQAGNGASCR